MKLILTAALVASACAEPFYDDEIGVEGVPVDEGALAGTFAMKGQAVDQAETILGKVDTGGMSFYRLERTWDAAAKVYQEHIEVCAVVNFEAAGLSSVNNPDAIDAIPDMDVEVTVDHATGLFERGQFQEMWGIRDLDPDDDIPQDVADDRFYDSDKDDHPGATTFTSGLVEDGEVYFGQRKTVNSHGVVQGTDKSFGLQTSVKESKTLGANNDLLLNESPRIPHPDPKESWWIELRIDDDDGCAKVIEMRDDETLPRRRPF